MSLLPTSSLPRIDTLRAPLDIRRAAEFDALLVMAPDSGAEFDRRVAALPESTRWAGLHARLPARAGTVRSTRLANARQSLAVLGYLGRQASAFERLALAGRMMKELAGQCAGRIALLSVDEPGCDVEPLLASALAQAFVMPKFASKPDPERHIARIAIPAAAGIDLARARATARGTNLARWLTALPPNRLDAPSYRHLAARLARHARISQRWLDERMLRRLGAGAFLAVAAGNAARNAGILHLRYRPGRRGNRPDIALVGKGILFDTGGNNLKSHRGMLDMHTDKAGSAVALATLLALAELEVPVAVDAWLAITENRIGPTAYRPQDVVRAANGVTIQVIHTDAEGRMVLADTLALAGRTRPRLMLDFATLTGACVQAVTERMSGAFAGDAALAAALVAAGHASGERVWNFPLAEDYDAELESRTADVVQCTPDNKGDHIYAARFLRRFVPENVPGRTSI
ncbi:MAG: leucyl aminopeptidase family protein [Gammaproteobacteria bacterium]|nr:leucyl aminopeptidase family protein [Gammaproteobacteria bacterium]